ncbi:hypothetical protein XELAEV_18002118mg [Xenopus laevis]|nr:hypothetical protein XELAEV_18002118mg [Xenopus laevis]
MHLIQHCLQCCLYRLSLLCAQMTKREVMLGQIGQCHNFFYRCKYSLVRPAWIFLRYNPLHPPSAYLYSSRISVNS